MRLLIVLLLLVGSSYAAPKPWNNDLVEADRSEVNPLTSDTQWMDVSHSRIARGASEEEEIDEEDEDWDAATEDAEYESEHRAQVFPNPAEYTANYSSTMASPTTAPTPPTESTTLEPNTPPPTTTSSPTTAPTPCEPRTLEPNTPPSTMASSPTTAPTTPTPEPPTMDTNTPFPTMPTTTPPTNISYPTPTTESTTTDTAETLPPTTTLSPTTDSEVHVSIVFAKPEDSFDRPHLPPVSTLQLSPGPMLPYPYNPFSMAGAPPAPIQPFGFPPTVQMAPQITFELTPRVVWKPVVQVVPMPYTQYASHFPGPSPFMQVPAVNPFGAQEFPSFESHPQPQSHPPSHIDPPTEVDDSISKRLAKTLMKNEEFADIFADVVSKDLPHEANPIELSENSLKDQESITAALLQTFRENQKFKRLLANAYAEVKGLDDRRDEFILQFVETLINDHDYETELVTTFEEASQAKWHDRFEKLTADQWPLV